MDGRFFLGLAAVVVVALVVACASSQPSAPTT
jgi:hypothetical protein